MLASSIPCLCTWKIKWWWWVYTCEKPGLKHHVNLWAYRHGTRTCSCARQLQICYSYTFTCDIHSHVQISYLCMRLEHLHTSGLHICLYVRLGSCDLLSGLPCIPFHRGGPWPRLHAWIVAMWMLIKGTFPFIVTHTGSGGSIFWRAIGSRTEGRVWFSFPLWI